MNSVSFAKKLSELALGTQILAERNSLSSLPGTRECRKTELGSVVETVLSETVFGPSLRSGLEHLTNAVSTFVDSRADTCEGDGT